MQVEVKSAEVRDVQGVAKLTGKPYHIREQRAWVDLGKAYPLEVTINLQAKQEAFTPGRYVVGPDCFWIARGGKLSIDLSRMRPAVAAAQSKAG